MATIDRNDLELALEWVSSDSFDNEAYASLKTGKIYWVADEEGLTEEENVPDDLDDIDKYVPIPDKRDLDLGTALVYDFTRRYLPQHYDRVRGIFRRRGAYGRFKDLLESEDKLEDWYAYSYAEEKKALDNWCKEVGFELSP